MHKTTPQTHKLTSAKAAAFYAVAFLGEVAQAYNAPDIRNVRANAQHLHHTASYLKGYSTGVARNWHRKPWSKAKAAAPFVASLAWANLVFGESLALVGQGLVERGDAHGAVSFATHMVIALVIEVGFTYPIAVRNDRVRAETGKAKSTAADVLHGSATAFWLGGAMGVDEKKLGRQHMVYPIVAYLLFAVILASIGNYQDLAAKIIETPAFFIALIDAGLVKKVNEVTGYKGGLERMADRTVHMVKRLDRSRVRSTLQPRALAKKR